MILFSIFQATESIKMLVTLCQSDNEEIRKVASETLLSLGELPALQQHFVFFLNRSTRKTSELRKNRLKAYVLQNYSFWKSWKMDQKERNWTIDTIDSFNYLGSRKGKIAKEKLTKEIYFIITLCLKNKCRHSVQHLLLKLCRRTVFVFCFSYGA